MKNQDLTTNEIFMAIASVFLLISMFVFFSSNVSAAVIMGILGILLLPPVNRKINEKIIKENKTRNYIKIVLEIIMFIFILSNLSSTDNIKENNELAKENVSNNTKMENVLNTTNNASVNNVKTKNIADNTSIEENVISTSSIPVSTKTEVTESGNSKENTKDVKEETQMATSSSSTSSNPSSTSKSTSSSSSGSTSKQSSSSSASSSTTNSQTVYVTPTGKRYHLSPTCGGKNSRATTLSNAKSMGLTPCKKCAQ